jgi:hypothetical protein
MDTPFSIVKPDKVTCAATPAKGSTSNTRDPWYAPLIANKSAPGPSIVTLLLAPNDQFAGEIDGLAIQVGGEGDGVKFLLDPEAQRAAEGVIQGAGDGIGAGQPTIFEHFQPRPKA